MITVNNIVLFSTATSPGSENEDQVGQKIDSSTCSGTTANKVTEGGVSVTNDEMGDVHDHTDNVGDGEGGVFDDTSVTEVSQRKHEHLPDNGDHADSKRVCLTR